MYLFLRNLVCKESFFFIISSFKTIDILINENFMSNLLILLTLYIKDCFKDCPHQVEGELML